MMTHAVKDVTSTIQEKMSILINVERRDKVYSLKTTVSSWIAFKALNIGPWGLISTANFSQTMHALYGVH